jgi:glycosyltransferase involved in cell wall biosynthesis
MSILVVGCARNIESKISESISILQNCFEKFGHVSFFIVESDSSDKTVEVLESLQAKYDLKFVTYGNIQHRFPKRTERIAFCRNRCIQHINEIATNEIFVVVADLDGINNELTSDAVGSCFARTGWDVVTANQAGPYYDLWALRKPDWQSDDCWRNYHFLVKGGVSKNIALISTILSRQIIIPQSENWISVLSAFGGIAIYKPDCFKNNRYVGLSVDGQEVCEHVTFHLNLINRGMNIFINPAFVNSGYNEHTLHHKTFFESNFIKK